MKTRIFISAVCLAVAMAAQGQTLCEFNAKVSETGKRKIKEAPKKVYIASFNVFFEVYKESIDYKRGGSMLGGGERSSATARAAVGLGGIDANDVQEKTNQLYTGFVAELKKAGLEIIPSEVAAKTEVYEDWEKATGPFVKESGMPGVLLCVPDGHSQYFRGMKANGKRKKGMLDHIIPTILSDQMGDIIIANVNLYFMFAEEGNNAFAGNAAKVKIFTNLRMVGDFTVAAPAKKGFLSMKGQEDFTRISSGVSFHQGKKGLYSPVLFGVNLKKPLEVEGVIKKEKIVAYQKQGSSVPTSFSGVSYMDTANRFSKNATWIDVDSKKYADGLYMAAKKMIDTATKSLTGNL